MLLFVTYKMPMLLMQLQCHEDKPLTGAFFSVHLVADVRCAHVCAHGWLTSSMSAYKFLVDVQRRETVLWPTFCCCQSSFGSKLRQILVSLVFCPSFAVKQKHQDSLKSTACKQQTMFGRLIPSPVGVLPLMSHFPSILPSFCLFFFISWSSCL